MGSRSPFHLAAIVLSQPNGGGHFAILIQRDNRWCLLDHLHPNVCGLWEWEEIWHKGHAGNWCPRMVVCHCATKAGVVTRVANARAASCGNWVARSDQAPPAWASEAATGNTSQSRQRNKAALPQPATSAAST